jgi:uncharacterized coiled-coil protein SlyX
MAEKDQVRSIEQRMTRLEEWIMHTDHLLTSLNDTICAFQDRLDEQDQVIARLKTAAVQKTGGDEEQRSLEDERPPHY